MTMHSQNDFLDAEIEQAAFEAEEAAVDDDSSENDTVLSVTDSTQKAHTTPEATATLEKASTALADGQYTEVACLDQVIASPPS